MWIKEEVAILPFSSPLNPQQHIKIVNNFLKAAEEDLLLLLSSINTSKANKSLCRENDSVSPCTGTYSEISKADTEFCWFRTSGMRLTPQQQSGSQKGAGFSAHLSVGEYGQTTTKLIAKNIAIYIYL